MVGDVNISRATSAARGLRFPWGFAPGHARCAGWAARAARVGLAAWLVVAPAPLPAVTLEELRSAEKLTPKKFAGYFSDFKYEYLDEIQPPAKFLARQSGDCDDYAILADLVLRGHGYQTRLVHVRMIGLVAHAVCYVTEDKLYLDYNNRVYVIKTQRCGPELRDIAGKVADSFEANWTSVSEFVYVNGLKRIVQTVPKVAAERSTKPEKKIVIDF